MEQYWNMILQNIQYLEGITVSTNVLQSFNFT